ncbi:MAG: DMT family transporter [Planctomycetota bacterium]|nr:MAG: DMT family transporter [Planctomycetota bacterium]GDY07787.1 membrane protein [Planctomycetia bacterium]
MPSPDSDLTLSPPHPVALSATRGRTLLIAAAILWSLNGVIVKSPPLQAIPLEDRGWLLACYRALFASIALLPLVKWQRVRWRPGLLVSAATFTAMNTLFVIGLTRTSAAAAAFLQYTSTVWVFLFGWFALKERVHRGNVVALLCTVAGIAFIVLSERDQQRADGNLIALGSGVAFAGVILSLRWLRDEDSAWLTLLNHFVSGVVLLPIVLPRGNELQPLQWLLIALLGVVQMGLPYVLAARGIALVTVQEAALLLLLEPLLNPLWVWLCWGEHVGWSTVIGGGLILGGLAIRYVIWPEPHSTRRS